MKRPTHTERDRGWKRIKREFDKALLRPHVLVGIFGAKAAADHDGRPNVQIAATHEFGLTLDHPGGTAYVMRGNAPMFVSNMVAAVLAETTGEELPRTGPHKIKIPERSFIRRTVDKKRRLILKRSRSLFGKVTNGSLTMRRALGLLGLSVKKQMQHRIACGIAPPLHEITIARKGSSKPLINTGQLRASIDFEVRNA